MKNVAKKLVIGITAVACAFAFASCASQDTGKTPDSDGGITDTRTFGEKQVARAKQTYESFYNKKGGLFGTLPSTQSAAKIAAYNADVAAESMLNNQSPIFNTVRETLDKYPVSPSINIKSIFNSYVADIFSYSQVQTSIIDQFKESSLKDVYALTYENVDWKSDTSGQGYWIEQTKLLSAAFAGTNLENGNVYCTQAHISNRVLVLANVEYFYNSDGDMGVTTINYHGNGRFEYHYCSAGSYEILQAFGGYDSDGNITLTSFTAMNKEGRRESARFEQEDIRFVYSYVLSEVERINGTMDDLQKLNEREVTLNGTEAEGGVHIGVCSVNFDFATLSKMLIK